MKAAGYITRKSAGSLRDLHIYENPEEFEAAIKGLANNDSWGQLSWINAAVYHASESPTAGLERERDVALAALATACHQIARMVDRMGDTDYIARLARDLRRAASAPHAGYSFDKKLAYFLPPDRQQKEVAPADAE